KKYLGRLPDRVYPSFKLTLEHEEQPGQWRTIQIERVLEAPSAKLYFGMGGLTCIQQTYAFAYHPVDAYKTGQFRLRIADEYLPNIRGVKEIRIRPFEGAIINEKTKGEQGQSAKASADETYFLEGLSADVYFTMETTGFSANRQDAMSLEFSPLDEMINPSSLAIRQFPVQKKPDGTYHILRSPVQPQMEVQNKIAMLQPRATINSAAMLNGAQPTPTITDASEASPAGQMHGEDYWANMIGADELSPAFLLFALAASVFFGAAHALSPGHGKTIVAAYLVGSRGTIWHAVFLGLVVTLTHVSSVILLGIITLSLSEYVVPDKLYPIMEGASGLLIIAIGISIFFQRYGAYQRMQAVAAAAAAPPAHAHGHTHEHHTHDHSHDDHSHAHDHDHGHSHDHGEQTHAHDEHTHSHDHDHHHHDHTHDHDHHHHLGLDDWLGHDHGEHTHTHDIPADATWRDLLVLGVTGGIVPCPSAVIVLLAAIALKRLLFGLLLILFFSVGLAAVLITIGILVVSAKSILDRFEGSGRSLQWLQIASPALVTLLGVVILIRGLMTGGIISINL
ncbi:hypothetical protein K8I31_19070, partial [bacterium]|nr:hypothetical protein [bacterium]